jgi:YidC/Oxa1 family membrane protein insertase
LNIWELIIQQPLINILIVMSHYLGGNFGVAIIFLTVIVNLCLLPLTMSQIRSAKKMQDLQPKLAELQKKFAKDKQKLAQEQMRLYKESGVKPAGCALTMIIQMPVWIALYQSIMLALAAAPEGLLNLSKYLYPWNVVYSSLPLSSQFLGMNLALASPPGSYIMALLVGASMWIQQKMSSTPNPDPRQQQQTQMMLWMMPMLFAFMALSFPSGLSLYWVTSSIFRIVLQYRVSGWGGMRRQVAPTTEADKKYLKFEAEQGKKTVEEKRAEIVITDKESLKKSTKAKKPGKFRFLSGDDNEPGNLKK